MMDFGLKLKVSLTMSSSFCSSMVELIAHITAWVKAFLLDGDFLGYTMAIPCRRWR